MRKLILLIIALSLLVPVLPASAQQEKIDVYQQKKLVKSVVFQLGLNEYFVDNKVPGTKMDVAPFIENGRTYVPVRFLSNALGVRDENIFWFGDTGQVKLQEPGFNTVELTVGKVEVLSNGTPVPGVDVAPVIRNSRTFLPARFVANALGYDVDWDPALNLVVCWPKGEPKPDISAVKAELENWKWTEGGYKLPDPEGKLINKELSARWDNGTYWTKAGLKIWPYFSRTPQNNPHKVDLLLLIMPPDYKGSWEAYDQAQEILASKFGAEFAGRVMDYVRQKKSWRDDLPLKEYIAPNGQKLLVGAGEGIQITVYLVN